MRFINTPVSTRWHNAYRSPQDLLPTFDSQVGSIFRQKELIPWRVSLVWVFLGSLLVILLWNSHGSESIAKAEGSVIATNGPLRVNPSNGRYFMDKNGKTIYLTGSHTWSNLIDNGVTNPPPAFDFTAYLDFLEANHHNFFRLWRAENARGGEKGDNYWFDPMPYQRPGPGTAWDGKPKFDLNAFNQAYFDRMRQRIIDAKQRGIYVSIMLFDGWSIEGKIPNHDPWLGHPYNADNNINGVNGDPNGISEGTAIQSLTSPISPTIVLLQEAYIRKVIDTVNDLDNVLYEISNESPGTSNDWQYHMIRYIKGYEASKPFQHPVGMTVEWPNGDNAELFASPADWISPKGDINNPDVANGSKVILSDTDHLCGICGNRQWVWKSFTRGENPIFMDQYDGASTGRGAESNYNPNNPKDQSLRKNLGYTLDYARRINLAAMTPHGELASSGYCLANPSAQKAEYLVYLPSGGSVSVNLSGTSGTLMVEWFDPSTGATSNGNDVQGGGTRSFTSPYGGDTVLYLHANDLNSSTPTSTLIPTHAPLPTSTQTSIPVATSTSTSTPVQLPTRTSTPLPTFTASSTSVGSGTATATAEPTLTSTPNITIVATSTKLPTATPLPTATNPCYYYSSKDTPLVLTSDGNQKSSTLVVDQLHQIADLNVGVSLHHSYVGDLKISLLHVASGKKSVLFDRPGVPKSTFGCKYDDLAAIFSDEAFRRTENRCIPELPTFNGSYRPVSTLAVFNNLTSNGEWQLVVDDLDPFADSGELLEWSMEICLDENVQGSQLPDVIESWVDSVPADEVGDKEERVITTVFLPFITR